ncbi:MAG: ABC transporter permease [Bacteroidales bacterium]|nr:ABC transporter permease [Bacteroidales bacterium]
MNIGIVDSVKRELRRMVTMPMYLVFMVLCPIGCGLIFMSLLSAGLPLRTPAAVVDLDHSELSRQVIRNLNSNELVDVQYKLESYSDALAYVREGKIFGFFIISRDFEKDALAGKKPTIDLYSNMTYFVPGTFAFKGFKLVAVSTTGGLAAAKLAAVGLTPDQITALSVPVDIDIHGIGNPWTNYSYYLTPSFTFATVALLMMLFTVFSITVEIKHSTSPQWLMTAKGNIAVAVFGKLLPQTVLGVIVCFLLEAVMFGFLHFPMNGSLWWMLVATVLFVIATQSFAVMVASILPNPRIALSVVSLIGVLTFSFGGFSFPVEKMYGAIAAFSYIVPIRYWFLIYVNIALNGFDVYFVRFYFVALLIFPYLGMAFLWKLKKACLHPVYIP